MFCLIVDFSDFTVIMVNDHSRNVLRSLKIRQNKHVLYKRKKDIKI